MTTEQWQIAITKLCSMGVSNVAFTGGEPTLRSDLPQLIRHAASCQVKLIETVDGVLKTRQASPNVYLLTNGRNMNRDILGLCRDYAVQLSMSLPGLDTFEAHTGYDGADSVLKSFEQARRMGIKTVANITVTQKNLYELQETIAAALLAGADQVLLNRFLPGGRGLQYTKDLSLTAEQLTEMLDIAEETLQAANRYGSLGTEVPRCLIDPSRYTNLQVSTRCAAAISFFVVGPSGHIRVCNHSPIELDHIDNIENLKRNPYWNIFTQKKYLPESCASCTDRLECDGGCREAAHIMGGTVDAPDVLFNRYVSERQIHQD
jgi:radical SAM protein with 4Fe4S-binding SPASM domain